MTARLSPARLGIGLAALAAVVTLTGCGGSDDKTSASPSNPGGDGSSTQAFQECLRKQGVQMPQGRRSGPPPSGQPGQGAPSGRPSGGPGGGMRSLPPEQQKALQACASLRRTSRKGEGFGNGQGPGGAGALTAFRDCMNKNGAKVAANARPDDLKTSDPKVAEALKICRPLLPQRGASPTPTTS